MSIDTLITRNRDTFSVGVASDDERSSLVASPIEGRFSGRIDGWHLVALRLKSSGEPVVSVRCLGYLQGDTWITSQVEAIAADGSAIRTRNSVYQLGSPGVGDPDQRLVRQLAIALVSWGMNEQFNLGIFGS